MLVVCREGSKIVFTHLKDVPLLSPQLNLFVEAHRLDLASHDSACIGTVNRIFAQFFSNFGRSYCKLPPARYPQTRYPYPIATALISGK